MLDWFTVFHLIGDTARMPLAHTTPRLFFGVGAVTALLFFVFGVLDLLMNASADVTPATRCENTRNASRALLLTLLILTAGNYGGMLILMCGGVGICYFFYLLMKGIIRSIGSCRDTTA
jgi:hypothetical protein